jgi:hypothetical protein
MIGLDNPMYPNAQIFRWIQRTCARTRFPTSRVLHNIEKEDADKTIQGVTILGDCKTLMNANNKWKSLTHGAKRTEKKTSIFFPLHFI